MDPVSIESDSRVSQFRSHPVVFGEVGFADGDVLADVDPQSFDLVGMMQVPGDVLAAVFARLGGVVAQPPVHVDPYAPAQFRIGGDALVQQRVEVLAAAFPPQHPGLVVHAGRPVGHLVVRHVDELTQADHRPVDGMAQPEHLQLRGDAMEERDVHGHRVRVVEQPGVGAHLRHVPRDVGQDREGPQAAEDSADADGVGDGLIQPVARRDLEVAHRGLVHADRDDVDDVVRAVECAPAVAGGDHLRFGAGRASGGSGDGLRGLQPFDRRCRAAPPEPSPAPGTTGCRRAARG